MKTNFISLFSIILGLILIFLVIPYFFKDASPFPSILHIYDELKVDSEANDILPAIGNTFIRFAAAVIIGGILGILLGIIQAHIKLIKAIISPWLDILRITPAIVWISVLYVIHIFPNSFIPIFIGLCYSSLYVSIQVEESISNISKEEQTYIFAQRLNDDFNWKVAYCYLPRIKAATTSGIKVGGSIALILVVVSEAFTSTEDSIGRLLFGFQTLGKQELLWVVIVSLSIIALLFFGLFTNLEKLTGGKIK